MLTVLLLSSSILVTHASGWSYPMITTDLWSYSGQQDKSIVVINGILHQFWDKYDQEVRIGYKAYLPNGTVIFPETMVSSDVWSINPTATLIGGDSIAGFWRQGVPAWYCVRDSAGGEAVATSLFQSDPYYNRPNVEVASDSLGRIHAVTVIPEGVLYSVFEPGIGEVQRDTVPDSWHDTAQILVDGNRVHIIYHLGNDHLGYVQYDLDGNVTVPPISLIEGLADLSTQFDMALDADRNLYLFCKYSWGSGYYLALFKIDGATGDILISDKEIWDPEYTSQSQTILRHPDGDRMSLIWIEGADEGQLLINYALIDTNGDFIEEPYNAYDYTDEEVQQISTLDASISADGDIFAIWSHIDWEVDGYQIVLGWFDHNWVGIEEELTTPVETSVFSLQPSANPFSESVTVTVEGAPIPGQLAVYDLSGRVVRTLFRNGGGSFLWDGNDSSSEELPAGSYIIEGASSGRVASVTVVKL